MDISSSWMNKVAFVPISVETYVDVLARSPVGAQALIESVVRDYLDRTADGGHDEKFRGGVRFGTAFLNDGTRLRTKYKSAYLYMEIEGGQVRYDGRLFASVSQAANVARGNTSNNAWKVLEIRRPGDPTWVPADQLRRTLR